MSKLTGKKKAEFLARMARGRKKAARGKPKPRKKTKKNVTRPAAPSRGKSRPNAGPRSVRKSKKAMKKFLPGFKRKRRNSQNSMSGAKAMFEQFHGKPAGRIIDYEQVYRYPDKFAEIGLPLRELRFDLDTHNRDFPLSDFGRCQVVTTPDGTNIYFLGGDQKIDFDALNISSDKDFVELGPCTYIEYHTVKGFHDFEPTDYRHRFGEEDGVQPVLAYDRRNHTLFLIGGAYRVRPEGIVN